MKILPTATFQVTQACNTCGGRGYVDEARSHCTYCGHQFTQEELKADNEAFDSYVARKHLAHGMSQILMENQPPMSCGHEIAYLREEQDCSDCEGTGSFTIRITIAELAQVIKEVNDAKSR